MKTILILSFFIVLVIAVMQGSPKSLKQGDEAPPFALSDETGTVRTLAEFKGKKVLLYFYPKDGTSGCTAQACGLRDHFSEYRDNKIIVIGVNYDSPESHKKFKENNHLPDDFILLIDSKKEVARQYGAYSGWFKWFVPARISILINEQGKVVDVIHNVDVKKHAQQIIERFKKPSK